MAHATNGIQAIVATAGDGVITLIDSFVTGDLVILPMALFIDGSVTAAVLLPMPVIAWATSRYGSMIHQYLHLARVTFSAMNDKVQKNITVVRVDALYDPTILAVVGFSFFLSMAYGSYLVTGGELTIGELTRFTIYLGNPV